MRHLQTTKRLNRPLGARNALIRNLLVQLYTHETITTTQAKAKLIQPFADRLINKAKNNTVHQQRLISATLNNSTAVKKLFHQIAPRYQRNSGFTKIIKTGRRIGDNSLIAQISLISADQSVTNNNSTTTKDKKDTKIITKPAKTKKSKNQKALKH